MYRASDKASWKEMEGLVIVVDTDTGSYYSLNETASAIWSEIALGKSPAETAEAVSARFEVDAETLDNDINSCIQEWINEGLILEKM